MFDAKFIRDNPEVFDKSLKRRGFNVNVDQILDYYKDYTLALTNLQKLQMDRNQISKDIGIKKSKGQSAENLQVKVVQVKEKLSSLQEKSEAVYMKLRNILEVIPNLPSRDVPDGLSENENIEIRKNGVIRKFSFKPESHDLLGSKLNMMDFERAALMSGSRFVILKSDLAKLERALSQFMIDYHVKYNNYCEVSPPSLVKSETMFGTGQLPKFSEDLFQTTSGHWLIPTAEVPLTNMFAGEIMIPADLPKRYTALTSCFRAEAGAAGKDTKGMIRLHEFKKVELVSIVENNQSEYELDHMLKCAEEILRLLKLPYRVVELCCGDLGFSAMKTYDIEVWIPSQNKYREISSCSNCGEFQSRRMNTKIKNANGKIDFVHTLNGSGVAVGRALVAILENYQEEDGSIRIPEALVDYMGGLKEIKKKDDS